jgi:hypothetical protein
VRYDVAGPLPADDLQLNPDATRPPFEWAVGIPSDWALLDTNPASWQRNAQRLVDYKFAGRRLAARERREVLAYLESLVADCQRADAVLTVVQFGPVADSTLGSAGVTMAWYSLGPQPATLNAVGDAIGNSGTVTNVDTPCGVSLLHQDRISLVPPGALTRVASQTFKLFIPVHRTSWIAIISGGTSTPALEPIVRDVVIAMGESLSVALPEDSRAASTSANPREPHSGHDTEGRDPEFTAVNIAVPGLERGFGTLVRRRARPRDTDA